MSELPAIDPVKIHQKTIQKLEKDLRETRNSESTLETLAEALRDERDEFMKKLAEAEQKLSALQQEDGPVDITSLS